MKLLQRIIGAGAASAVPAEKVASAVALSRGRMAAALTLVSGVIIAIAWVNHKSKPDPPFSDANAALVASPTVSELMQKPDPSSPQWVSCTVRGVVRDEQGRPVAKAWIGRHLALSAKKDWELTSAQTLGDPAERTDSAGKFILDFTLSARGERVIHFASPDFSQQAIHSARALDPDKPLEITLRPVRQVSAFVIEDHKNDPSEGLSWDVYSVDPAHGQLSKLPELGDSGARLFRVGFLPIGSDAPGSRPQLKAALASGRYKVKFESSTVDRVVDVIVPPGVGPLVLPDIHLETMAWVRMLGKPAAEIEAVDQDDKPVKLSDFRGKVVVVTFWSSTQDPSLKSIHEVIEVQERFKGQPVEILALHDASLTSRESRAQALANLRSEIPSESPIRFLFDRAPIAKSSRTGAASAGEPGSGLTRDIYEVSNHAATFVIGKQGGLFEANPSEWVAFRRGKDGELTSEHAELKGDQEINRREFRMRALRAALENQLELPRSPL